VLLSTLEDIKVSIELVLKRFRHIPNSDAFLADEEGLEKLDSISMRLIAIGEGFKNVDKLSGYTLLQNYPSIQWKKVKGIRDVLSHHYFDLDAETVFNVCQNHLNNLLDVTIRIIEDMKYSDEN